jgi:hypothetical protein
MHTAPVILVALALLAYAFSRSNGIKPAWSQHLTGSRKIFGLAAFIGAVLILINPEFLALGLLGDTAFFEMLVLALSLQMHVFVTRAFYRCVDVLSGVVRWVGIPSPGLLYCVAVVTPIVAGAVALFQRTLHRNLS